MEKSVLILSDLNLVTGLGILLAGYSQLNCGISAYHLQIMVFVAWFASYSFVSAMTFLEGYFQTNNSMRIIRVFCMIVPASLLIAALLPTGSSTWLNQYPDDDQGFYPGLSAACFYRELGKKSFLQHGPKIWSMIFSVVVVAVSYIHSGIRLLPIPELVNAGDISNEDEEGKGSPDPHNPTPTSSATKRVELPRFPYAPFTPHSWYTDHILLLLCQIIMVTTMARWVITKMADIFGISSILCSRLFLIRSLGVIPCASLIHLAVWYVAALILGRMRGWPTGGRGRKFDVGKVVYWVLRIGLVVGCLVFTLFNSLELAGPDELWEDLSS
jgi:hypothetical protein